MAVDVIIFGANVIGEYIAQTLQEHYDILVLDKDQKRADIIAEKYDVDVIPEISMEVLDKLPWDKVSYVYAVTDNIQENVLLAIYAKSRGVPTVVCRIDDESYRDLLKRMNIKVISNVNLAQHALLITHKPLIYKLMSLDESQVVLEEVEGKKYKGKRVVEVEEKLNVRVVAIYRAHEFFIPEQTAEILEEDRLVVAKQVL